MLSPDLGEHTQQLLVGKGTQCLPLVSTPYPFVKQSMKKLSQSSGGSIEEGNVLFLC